jgi:valyl-tRNA synthetase
LINKTEFFIPLGDKVDAGAERERIQKELEYNRGFLESVMKKLGNQNFVSKAKPEIIASEEKKKADAEMKIKVLEEQLNGL